MKASELIEKLTDLVEAEGDLEVCVRAGVLTMVTTRVELVRLNEMREEGALKLEYVLID